ncbi:hypothetical protein FOA52_005059 [Chlamydomonas sp. UWO 241]|nr:hypothetical protein FOA52_005059 [Chlamydomonas sp. UWO 241]
MQHEPHATIEEARDALAAFSSSLMGHMLDDDHERRDLARFDRWKVTGSCPANRPLTKYGGITSQHPTKGPVEDGHKYFCDVGIPEFNGPAANCLIFSLGSNGDYSFERFMLNATNCHVHTFDCTFNGASQMPGRHTYHQVCLGPDNAAQTNTASAAESARRTGNAKPVYKSWATISAELNPGGHKRIAVLKCDIEGGEYSMVADLKAAAGQALPEQLAIEVHLTDAWKVTLWHVHALHAHLAHLGYALVSHLRARASPSHAMTAPLPRRDVKNLVRMLSVESRPGQQKQALETISEMCYDRDPDFLSAIAAAGAIPAVVKLLGPGSSAEVQ